eukprot:3449480-Pyramimonas_sp.AAC.2
MHLLLPSATSCLRKFGSCAARLASSHVRRETYARNKRLCFLTIAPKNKQRHSPVYSTRCSSATDLDVFTFFEDYVIRSCRADEDGEEKAASVRAALSDSKGKGFIREAAGGDKGINVQEFCSPVLLITELEGEDGSAPKVIGYTAYHGSSSGDETVSKDKRNYMSDPGGADVTPTCHTCVLGSTLKEERAEALSAFATSVMESHIESARGRDVSLGENRTGTQLSEAQLTPGSVQSVMGEARASTEKGSREHLEVRHRTKSF